MAENSSEIILIRMDDGRWRVFTDEFDEGVAFQFPWDALQCVLNGSLSGKPVSALQTIKINVTTAVDSDRVEIVRKAETEKRALMASLRGLDGEGI